jgi:hypothetical protein
MEQVGGTHDEVAEAVLRALTITDETGEKANLTLQQKWLAESKVSDNGMACTSNLWMNPRLC